VKMSAEMLIDAIKTDGLEVPNEEVVLTAVLRWVNHDVERESIFPKVGVILYLVPRLLLHMGAEYMYCLKLSLHG